MNQTVKAGMDGKTMRKMFMGGADGNAKLPVKVQSTMARKTKAKTKRKRKGVMGGKPLRPPKNMITGTYGKKGKKKSATTPDESLPHTPQGAVTGRPGLKQGLSR